MSDHHSPFRLLSQRRFGPFFVTEFLGAFNDNLFKNVLVLLVTFNTAKFTSLSAGVLSNIAAGLFILPFVLFSAIAGDIADRMDKGRLIRIIKTVEVLIMILAGFGLAISSLPLLFTALFMMGTHSAFFGPTKYSILPQVLDETELVSGNAWVGMGTFVAILLGTLAAGYLLTITEHPLTISFAWVGFALAGLLASWWIPPTLPAATASQQPLLARFGWSASRELIQIAREKRPVWLSVLAISWFWLIGSIVLAQLPALVKDVVQADAAAVTGLLAVFSLSVGLGSLLCDRLSGDHVEIGLVPLGSIGISVFAIDLWWAGAHGQSLVAAQAAGVALKSIWHLPLYQRIATDLAMLGLFSGLFIVPLYSLVQLRTPKDKTSRVIAANNIMNALFMVIGAGLAAVGLSKGLTVPQVILAAGVMNAVVAVYIYSLVPEFLWRFVIWIMVNTIYRVEKQGLQYIPREGKALLICNHISFADAVMIAASVRRPVRFVMDHQIFKIWWMGWLFRTAKAIPIAPKAVDPGLYNNAFEQVKLELDDDSLVCIFPEGKISHDGEMNEFKAGIVRIIDQSPDVAVIPMALSGLWGSGFSRKEKSLWNRLINTRDVLRTIRVHIGAPITDERRRQPAILRDVVLDLRGNWL